ncbi:hypothetical protein RHS03_02570, partial [Rhizoctonia solani]
MVVPPLLAYVSLKQLKDERHVRTDSTPTLASYPPQLNRSHIVIMAESESEGGPRRSSRLRSPTKKVAQYADKQIEETKRRREDNDRKKTITKKRAGGGGGLKLMESGCSSLPSVPEQPPSPQGSQTPKTPDKTATLPAKGKGKGRLDDPQSAQAIVRSGRVISPDKEGRSGELDQTRSRPRLADSSTNSGAYEDQDLEMGVFDNEPPARRPLPVRAIDPTPPSTESQPLEQTGAGGRKSQSATNLFSRKRPVDPEYEDSQANKRRQMELNTASTTNNGGQIQSQSTVRGEEYATRERPVNLPRSSESLYAAHDVSTKNRRRGPDKDHPRESANNFDRQRGDSRAAPHQPLSPRRRAPNPAENLDQPRGNSHSARPLPTPPRPRPSNHVDNLKRPGATTQASRLRSPSPGRRVPNPTEVSNRPRGNPQSSWPRSPSPRRRAPNPAGNLDRMRETSRSRPLSPRQRIPNPAGNSDRPRGSSQAARPRSQSPRRRTFNPTENMSQPRGDAQAARPHLPPPNHRSRSPGTRSHDNTVPRGSLPYRAPSQPASSTARQSSSTSNRKDSRRGSSSTNTGSSSSHRRTSTSSRGSRTSARWTTGASSSSRRGSRSSHARAEDENDIEEADDENKEEEYSKRGGNKGTRGRLKDFVGVEKEILTWAGRAFQAIMLTKGMYETDIDILDDRRLEAWMIGCEKFKKNISNFPISMAHIQNMNDCLVSWRTHAKSHIQDKAAAQYFPDDKRMTPAELEAHIKQLKAGGLHTKPGPSHGNGCFQHKLLQTCMDQMLFRFKCDIGVQFAELFKEPSAELICFFCAMLQFIVEERETGKTGTKELDFESQRKAYNTHLASHAVWLTIAKERWQLVQKQLFLRAFKNSGAQESSLPVDESGILREEELQPDIPDEEELATWQRELECLKANPRRTASGEWEDPVAEGEVRDSTRDGNPSLRSHGGEDWRLNTREQHRSPRNQRYDRDYDAGNDREGGEYNPRRDNSRNDRDYYRNRDHERYEERIDRDYGSAQDRRDVDEQDDVWSRGVYEERNEQYPSEGSSRRDNQGQDRRNDNRLRDDYRTQEDYRDHQYPEGSRRNSDSQNFNQDNNFRETFVSDNHNWELPPSNRPAHRDDYHYDNISGSYRNANEPIVWHYRDFLGDLQVLMTNPQHGNCERQSSPPGEFGDNYDEDGSPWVAPKPRPSEGSSGGLSD